MDPDFWRSRWRGNQIGFHQGAPSRYLVEHVEALDRGKPARVLVPLSGKSLDMTFLAERGHQVTGVELAREALVQYFAERGVEAREGVERGLPYLEGGGVRIHEADWFAFRADPFPLAFDRAALVAMPEQQRARYAAHLLDLMEPGGRILLITFHYAQQQMNGPPFAVADGEVERLFSPRASVEQLARRDILDDEPRFKARGLTHLEEAAWLLIKDGAR